MASRVEKLPINLLLAGVGLWLSWSVLKAIREAAPRATQPLANLLAKPAEWWIARSPVNVLASFVLQPSGQVLRPIDYPITWRNDVATITVNGALYKLGPRDERGNYPAWRVQT